MTFSQSLIEELKSTHLLKHPFYQAWMRGELSLEQLQDYAVQYYPHVLAFPQYVSAVHSRATDPRARRLLAENLADEEGLNGRTSHPELWLRFCEGLGVDREKVETAITKPAARALRDGFQKLTEVSYASGLGTVFAYEHQVPEVAKTKIEGLEKNYSVDDDRTLEFFRVHETADVYHTEACCEALDRLPKSEQQTVRLAAKESADLLWNFLTEAYSDVAC